MLKAKLRLDNARDPEQAERMRLLQKNGGCFFCDKNYLDIGASAALHENKDWYVKKNDYPYEGTRHHYLIVPKKHISRITDISPKTWLGLSKMVGWLETNFKIRGYSVFSRNGDMRYTGATLDHLHFHFLSGYPKQKNGRLEDNILVTLGHKPKK
jgi:diadenosine tetraphosphate (Ap4A) HIT family hydrolase